MNCRLAQVGALLAWNIWGTKGHVAYHPWCTKQGWWTSCCKSAPVATARNKRTVSVAQMDCDKADGAPQPSKNCWSSDSTIVSTSNASFRKTTSVVTGCWALWLGCNLICFGVLEAFRPSKGWDQIEGHGWPANFWHKCWDYVTGESQPIFGGQLFLQAGTPSTRQSIAWGLRRDFWEAGEWAISRWRGWRRALRYRISFPLYGDCLWGIPSAFRLLLLSFPSRKLTFPT